MGDAVPIFQHPEAEPHRDESSHPSIDDFFGPQPPWEERPAADPELRERIEKHWARPARRPSAGEVLMRQQREIDAVVEKVQERIAEDKATENDPELRAALAKRRDEEERASVDANGGEAEGEGQPRTVWPSRGGRHAEGDAVPTWTQAAQLGLWGLCGGTSPADLCGLSCDL